MSRTLIAEYKEFRIFHDKVNSEFTVHKPDGEQWYIMGGQNPDNVVNRAYELIDSAAGRAIIDAMNVTKSHTLQVGDIVTIRVALGAKTVIIGLIESIKDGVYYVSHLRQDKFYRKTELSVPYQLEKLTIYVNRERWLQIKRDLDRQEDGRILQDWIENV